MVIRYSTVIPLYNGADTIEAALASVVSQSLPPERVIVVDDGSSDASAATVRGFAESAPVPIVLIQQENRGPGAATTRGFAEVETPFIATLDADDIWLAGKIAAQAAYLEAHLELAAVFCPLANFRGDPASADLKAGQGGWSRSTMLIRTEAARSVGDIVDPPGRAGEMIDWLARARESGLQLGLMEEVWALRRIRPGSLTWGNDKLGQSYLHVARKALLRRRAAQGKKP